MAEQGVQFNYLIGTMIEIPRACVVADAIAMKQSSSLARTTPPR